MNYAPPHCRLDVTKKSFFPSTVSLWNDLSCDIRNSPNINIFKRKTKGELEKPPPFFSYGVRKLNIIHTRLRNMCSSLNADLHRINVVDNPSCDCGHAFEDCIHYFLECPLYTEQRAELFLKLREYDITIELLLAGDSGLTLDQNLNIFSHVHTYLKRTKRFDVF